MSLEHCAPIDASLGDYNAYFMEGDCKAVLNRIQEESVEECNARDPRGCSLLMHTLRSEFMTNDRDQLSYMCNIVGSALISKGVDLDAVDSRGNQALHYAASNRCVDYDVICAICDRMRDRASVNEAGQTPLMLALGAGHSTKIIDYLMGKYDSLAVDTGGNNALHYATKSHQPIAVVKRLLESRVPVNATNKEGETPALFAARIIGGDLLRFLRRHGADLNISKVDGSTAVESLICQYSLRSERYDKNLAVLRSLTVDDASAADTDPDHQIVLSPDTLGRAIVKSETLSKVDLRMLNVLRGALVVSNRQHAAWVGVRLAWIAGCLALSPDFPLRLRPDASLPPGAAGGAVGEGSTEDSPTASVATNYSSLPAGGAGGVGAHTILTVPNTECWQEIFAETHATRLAGSRAQHAHHSTLG